MMSRNRMPVTTSKPAETYIILSKVYLIPYIDISPSTVELNDGLYSSVLLFKHTLPKYAKLLAQVAEQAVIF